MTTAQAKVLIETDPDFVYSKRHEYSLNNMREKCPEGYSDRVVAAVMMVTEDDIASAHTRILEKLRRLMGVDSL